MVRINGCLSSTFTIERGVLQGSVLSPVLVMNPLLQGLEANHLGPSLRDIYIGAFAHADDIRTITSNLTTLKQQVKFVQEFCADNALTLNLSKCEVLAVSPTKPPLTSSLGTLDNQHASLATGGHDFAWNVMTSYIVTQFTRFRNLIGHDNHYYAIITQFTQFRNLIGHDKILVRDKLI